MRDALPFGVGGGLVAIKTLLSRDPCVHANTAIEMIDAILKEHPAAQPAPVQEPDLIARLKNPEDHYEFTDPKKANAVLMSLCQEAADALAAPTVQPMAHIVGEIDHTGKVWKPVQPAPVQEPVAWREFDGEGGYTYFAYQDNETWRDEYIERNGEKYANWVEPLYTASSTSHLHLLSDEFIYKVVRSSQPHLDDDCADWRRHFAECKYWLEIARGITPPPAQTALPDAMTSADIQEHIEYVAGWNDCRQAMLEMMK